MIKRIAAFVLLLASGLLVLSLAIGSDQLFPPSATNSGLESDPNDVGGGLHVGKPDGGGLNSSVRVRVSGAIEFISERRITLPNGSNRPLRRYWLRAEDSRLHPDETQELEEVRVVFYGVGGPADQPISKPSGFLEAQRAWVAIAEDETGRRRIAEDKEIDLRDVLLTTESDAEVPDLRLSVAELLVLSTARAIHLHTRNPAEPFDLDLGGNRPLHIKGRGLEAVLPSRGLQRNSSAETDLLINSQPILTVISPSRTTRLTASGTGRYREDLTSGLATIRLENKVRIEGLGIGEASGGRAQGDSLQASFRRKGAGSAAAGPDSETRLYKLHLVGTPDTPARLITPDLDLSCQQLDSLPGHNNEPYLVSASGSPKLITKGVRPVVSTFTADSNIHLVLLRNHLPPILGGFGFPEWALGPLLDQLVIFEGRSSIEDEGLRIRASEGVEVLRSPNAAGFLTVNGHGSVEIHEDTQGLVARGNRGFLLHATPDRETTFLGPRVASSGHHFQVQHADLLLSGTGACRLVRDKVEDAAVEIHLRSPISDIDAQLSTGRGQLTHASRLDARMDSRGLSSLEAAGDPCHLITTTADGRVEATALVVQSQEPNVWLFSGSPARVDRGSKGVLVGKEIRVAQLDGQNALLLATGRAQIELGHRRTEQPAQQQPEPSARTMVLGAASIEIIPFVAPPASIAFYARFLPSFARYLHQRLHTSGYLLARGSVEVQNHSIGSDESILASGETLIMSIEDASGFLSGHPARVKRTDGQQIISGIAGSIRFPSTSNSESMVLFPAGQLMPQLTIQGSSGSLARLSGRGGTTTIESRGPIRAGPEILQMADMVQIRSLRPDGSIHPDGAQLRANKMVISRDPQTGEALRVFAQGDTDLNWRGLRASSQELSLDLLRNLCVARGAEREAVVTLPDQTSCRGPWIEVNYQTYEVRAWKTLFTEGHGK